MAIGFVGLFGYILGELGANLVMPVLAERMSRAVSLSVLASMAVIAAVLYVTLSGREARAIEA